MAREPVLVTSLNVNSFLVLCDDGTLWEVAHGYKDRPAAWKLHPVPQIPISEVPEGWFDPKGDQGT